MAAKLVTDESEILTLVRIETRTLETFFFLTLYPLPISSFASKTLTLLTSSDSGLKASNFDHCPYNIFSLKMFRLVTRCYSVIDFFQNTKIELYL